MELKKEVKNIEMVKDFCEVINRHGDDSACDWTIYDMESVVEELKQKGYSKHPVYFKVVEVPTDLVEQIRKETAKGILSDLYLWINQDFDDIPDGGFIHIMKEDFKRRMDELYKRYGVCVEL